MPKILNKCFSAQKNFKVYNIRRCTSEPSLHSKSEGYLNLLKDYTSLLRAFESQGVEKRSINHQLDVLKNECNTLKEEIQSAQIVRCQVCFSEVHKSVAIQMGDCGHVACRPCFIQSVVHSAINLRQHNDVDTINEYWRCFLCREFNYSFLQNQRGVLIVKYIDYESELKDTILHDYRKLEKSLKLPPVSQEFQENELWQEIPEERIMVEQSVMSDNVQPNEEPETSNNLIKVESGGTVENVSSLESAQVPEAHISNWRSPNGRIGSDL